MKSVFKIYIFISVLCFPSASLAADEAADASIFTRLIGITGATWAMNIVNRPIVSFVGGASRFISIPPRMLDESEQSSEEDGNRSELTEKSADDSELTRIDLVPDDVWLNHIIRTAGRESWSPMSCVTKKFNTLLRLSRHAIVNQGFDELVPWRFSETAPIYGPASGWFGIPALLGWKDLTPPGPCPYLAFMEQRSHAGGYDESGRDLYTWFVRKGHAYGFYERSIIVVPKDTLIDSLRTSFSIFSIPFLHKCELPKRVYGLYRMGTHIFAEGSHGRKESIYHIRLDEHEGLVALPVLGGEGLYFFQLTKVLSGSGEKVAFLKVCYEPKHLSLGYLVRDEAGQFQSKELKELPSSLWDTSWEGLHPWLPHQFGNQAFLVLKRPNSETDFNLVRCNLDLEKKFYGQSFEGSFLELLQTEQGRLLLVLGLTSDDELVSIVVYSTDEKRNFVFENLGSIPFQGLKTTNVHCMVDVFGMAGDYLVLGARVCSSSARGTKTHIYYFNTHTGRVGFEEDLAYRALVGFVHGKTGEIYLYEDFNVPQDGERNVRILQPPCFCKDSKK